MYTVYMYITHMCVYIYYMYMREREKPGRAFVQSRHVVCRTAGALGTPKYMHVYK